MTLKPIGDTHWRRRKGSHISFKMPKNRIAELEAEVQLYKAKLDRAKQWLHNIFSAIEERLIG